MNIVYKKELNTNYLILDKPEKISEFAINMLLENEIPGLVPFEKRSFNGEESFYYDISGKYALENRIRMKALKEADVKGLLEGLLFTMQSCSSYFLDISGLSLEFELIFEEDGFYSFCFYPEENKKQEDMEEKIKILGERLISCVDHDDEQAVTLVYEFYRLAKENTLTIVQILLQLLKTPEKETREAGIVSIDEKMKPERDSLYDFSYEEKETEEITEAKKVKKQSERPDYLTPVIFLLPAAGSIFYFVYRFINAESFSLGAELSCREGILAAVFLILSLPGVFLSLYLDRGSRPVLREPPH